jgi:ABC-type transport system involved in multi-copper enzyme maturation permease subunit
VTHDARERPGFPGSAYDDARDDVRAPAWEEAAAAALTVAPHDDGDDEPLAPDQVAGNLRRYARWQWRDFWQRRGFWMAAAALFCVWLLVQYVLADRVRGAPGGGLARYPLQPDEVMGISHAAFAIGGVLAGLLGAGGIVSREREHGLQRFLFAKPVNVLRYYLQAFAVNGVGSLLVLLGTVLLAAAAAPQALSVATLLVVAAAGYLVGGGTTFLVSTLWRFDAPLAGAWLLAGFPVVALAENGWRWAQALQWLFPHAPALAAVKAVAPGFNGPGAEVLPLVFLLVALVAAVWGAGCVAAGAFVLRRRTISA